MPTEASGPSTVTRRRGATGSGPRRRSRWISRTTSTAARIGTSRRGRNRNRSRRRPCFSMRSSMAAGPSLVRPRRPATVAARLRCGPSHARARPRDAWHLAAILGGQAPQARGARRPMDRLYRSRDDRMLAGVAGGLAELWGADPSLVRVIWALLVLFTGGVALIVYIVMAIVIPEEPDVPLPVDGQAAAAAEGAPAAGQGWARPRTPGRAPGRTRGSRRRPPRRRRRPELVPGGRHPRRLPDHPRRLLPRPRVPARRSTSTGSGRSCWSASGSCWSCPRSAARATRARDHARPRPRSQRNWPSQPGSPPNRHLVSPARGPDRDRPAP